MKHLFLTLLMLAASVSYMKALAEDTDPDSFTSEDSSKGDSSDGVKLPIKRARAHRTISVSYENGVLTISPYNTYNEISILVTDTEAGDEYECIADLSDGEVSIYMNLPEGEYSIEITGDSLYYSSEISVEQE